MALTLLLCRRFVFFCCGVDVLFGCPGVVDCCLGVFIVRFDLFHFLVVAAGPVFSVF